jgi:hypothetical protein
MKVKELIEQLQNVDSELEVFISTTQGSFDRVINISEPTELALDYYKELGLENYQLKEHMDEQGRVYEIVKGIIL